MKQQEDAAQEQTDEMEGLLDEVCQALMDGATYKYIHGIPQNTMDGFMLMPMNSISKEN